MSYSRDEVKAITDRVIDMADADEVEVSFSGGERAACRYANSNITANLVEHDRILQITVFYGQKTATASTHQTDDESIRVALREVQALAQRKPDNPELMAPVEPPQPYVEVDAALPSVVSFGPAERARMVKQSIDVCEKKGVLGAGYVPRLHWTEAIANSRGLFGYHQYADASFILTCRTPDQTGSGWAGITGVRDLDQIDPVRLTEVAADKALRSRQPQPIEPGDYTMILEARPAARLLSIVLGSFDARAAEEGRSFMSADERGESRLGEQVFGDNVTIRSDIGHPLLRQTPIGQDGMAATDVTWVEQGVLRNLYTDRYWATRRSRPATPTRSNMSIVMEGGDATVDDMIRSTKRGLLATFFWYIRSVDPMQLLSTGMTRDGLFLIEDGEIVAPVQNFRWNESAAYAFNHITMLGAPEPMHMGEAYDRQGTALVPPMKIEEFTLTSISPAV